MSLRLAIPLALLCTAPAFGQNPAVDEPHLRPVGIEPTASATSLVELGLQRLGQGRAWDGWRSFREALHREPDCAMAELGRALAAQAQGQPRRAVEFAWKAHCLREHATEPAAAVIAAYTRYFAATTKPDRREPAHDRFPPQERLDELRATLAAMRDDVLAGRLLELETRSRTKATAAPPPEARTPRHPHLDPTTLAATFRPGVAAPGFDLPRGLGGRRTLQGYGDRPVLVVFFLGFGCVHCIQQLGDLQPHAQDFRDAGIEIVAIGTDTADQVKASFQMAQENGGDPLPFDVLCDPEHASFRAWQAYDEFDDEPLHGTFLVDRKGRILWQDVGLQPFMETDFLLAECRRLLAAWE